MWCLLAREWPPRVSDDGRELYINVFIHCNINIFIHIYKYNI